MAIACQTNHCLTEFQLIHGPINGELKLPTILTGSVNSGKSFRKGALSVYKNPTDGNLFVKFYYIDPPHVYVLNVAEQKLKARPYEDKLYISKKDNNQASYQLSVPKYPNQSKLIQDVAQLINDYEPKPDEITSCSSQKVARRVLNEDPNNNNVSSPTSNQKSSSKCTNFYGKFQLDSNDVNIKSPFSRGESTENKEIVPKARNVQTNLFDVSTSWSGVTAKPSPLAITNSVTSESNKEETSSNFDGFVNLGNTCYMNSVLQTLLAVPSFQCDLMRREHVDAVRHEISLPPTLLKFKSALDDFDHGWNENKENVSSNRTNKQANGSSSGATTQLYRVLIKLLADKMRRDKGLCREGSLDSRRQFLHSLKRAVASVEEQFSGFRQNDAHEFLSLFLDILREEVVRINQNQSKKPLFATSPVKTVLSSDSILCPVNSNFQLTVRHTIKCTSCELALDQEEKMLIMSVNLPEIKESENSNCGSIPNLVNSYFEDETLEYTCDRCGSKEAKLTHKIVHLPRVLIVHLKRYQVRDLSLKKDFRSVHISKYLSMSEVVLDCCDLPGLSADAFEEPTIEDFMLDATPHKSSLNRIDRLNLEEQKRTNEEEENDEGIFEPPDEVEVDENGNLVELKEDVKKETEVLLEQSVNNQQTDDEVSFKNSDGLDTENKSQSNLLKTPSSKLDKSDMASTVKKKKFSSERKVISPVRTNPNIKRNFNSDQGPRDRSRASTLSGNAVFSTDAGTSDDNEIRLLSTPPRKSKRIAEKSRESAKKKQSMRDVLGKKSAEKNKWEERKGSDLFGKPKVDNANLADDESQGGEDWHVNNRKRRKAHSPSYDFERVVESDDEDPELKKALQLSLMDVMDNDWSDAELQKALEMSRLESQANKPAVETQDIDCPPGFEEQVLLSRDDENEDDEFKGTVLDDDYLNYKDTDNNSCSDDAHNSDVESKVKSKRGLNAIKEEEDEVIDIRSDDDVISIDEKPTVQNKILKEAKLDPDDKGEPRDLNNANSDMVNAGGGGGATDSTEDEDGYMSCAETVYNGIQRCSTPPLDDNMRFRFTDLARLIGKGLEIPCDSNQVLSNSLSGETSTASQEDNLPTANDESGSDMMISNSVADVLNKRIDETETSIEQLSPCNEEGTNVERYESFPKYENSDDAENNNNIETEEKDGLNEEKENKSEPDIDFLKPEDSSFNIDSEEQSLEQMDPRHTYRLLSVICHLGQSASGGHYVSDVYNSKTDSWSCFDDETVTNRQEENVLKSRRKPGYIFFYMHQSMFPSHTNSGESDSVDYPEGS